MEAGGQIYGRKKYILNNLIYTTACWLARALLNIVNEKKVKFPKIGSTSDQYVSCIGTIFFSFPVIILSKRGGERKRDSGGQIEVPMPKKDALYMFFVFIFITDRHILFSFQVIILSNEGEKSGNRGEQIDQNFFSF